MWIPIIIGGILAWRWYKGLPLLPEFLSDPFRNGSTIVHTEVGPVAVPLDTPTKEVSPQMPAAVAVLNNAIAVTKASQDGGYLDPDTGNTVPDSPQVSTYRAFSGHVVMPRSSRRWR